MKAVLIDDEIKHTRYLVNLLAKYCPQVQVVATADSAQSGIREIQLQQPDIVFLDIVMPKENGFDLLAKLPGIRFSIIFVSGHDRFGVQAIKFAALDYLLKPVKPEELTEAVARAKDQAEQRNLSAQIAHLLSMTANPSCQPKIALKLAKGLELVAPEEILHLESANNYTRIFLTDGQKHLVSTGLFEYEETLKPFGFIRTHHSHLVNAKYVKRIEKGPVITELVMLDETRIPVSSRRITEVKAALLYTAKKWYHV